MWYLYRLDVSYKFYYVNFKFISIYLGFWVDNSYTQTQGFRRLSTTIYAFGDSLSISYYLLMQ